VQSALFRIHRPILLEAGFRVFFLLAAMAAVILIGLWLAMWLGAIPMPQGIDAVSWHAHEMLYGFVGAAMAGFLFTAVPNWTGRPGIRGFDLAVPALIWLAARFVMYFPEHLPRIAPMLVDGAYPVTLAVMIGREIVLARNRGNLIVVAVLGVWALANLVFHLALLNQWGALQHQALMAGLHTILFLVVLIGGRVIPAFTGNWLQTKGSKVSLRSRPIAEKAALPLAATVGAALVFAPDHPVTGIIALATALLLGARLSGWRGLHTAQEPLLLVLHGGYGWLAIGYLMMGIAIFTPAIATSAALHTLTVGGIGTMVMAIMSRAALGHSGRPLTASGALTGAYLLVAAAGLTRAGASILPALHADLLTVSGALWTVAFAVFGVLYWPILSQPSSGTGNPRA
jgi:uncharacterized protein involved in response to NO